MARRDPGPRDPLMTGRPQPEEVAAFASDLRDLRHAAGHPTLYALTQATSISTTVLSDAFAGRRLPTGNTVERLSTALGADPASWLDRRSRVAAGAGPNHAQPEHAIVGAPAVRGRVGLVIGGVALTMAVAVIAVTVWAGQSAVPTSAAGTGGAVEATRPPAPALPAARRADPQKTICAADEVATLGETVSGAGRIVLLRSDSCDSVWAEFTLLDPVIDVRDVTVEVFPEGDRYGGRSVAVAAVEPTVVRTGMVLEASRFDAVCATVGIGTAQTEVCLPHSAGR